MDLPASRLQTPDHSPTSVSSLIHPKPPSRSPKLPQHLADAEDTRTTLSALLPSRVNKMVPVSVVDGSANTSFATKLCWLIIYFMFNLGMTLSNKAILSQFELPYLMTAMHSLTGLLGSGILITRGIVVLKPLPTEDFLKLCAFSVLYTFNIAISNVSLAMVTLPFHQVLRATTPIFTVAIYRVFYANNYGVATYISLIPVIFGVGLATYGDYYTTVTGFFMTLIGAILAAVKTVATNRMQTSGLHLSAMELLCRLSPLAAMQSFAAAYMAGEVRIIHDIASDRNNWRFGVICGLILNAGLAFGLNITSFTSNKKAGALTMTVAANVKQTMTVLIGIVCWHFQVGWVNASGILITLAGSAWYAAVEMKGHTPPRSLLVQDLEVGKSG